MVTSLSHNMNLLTLVILLGKLENIPDDYICTDKFLLKWSFFENPNPHAGRTRLQLSSADALTYLSKLEKEIVNGTKPKTSILARKIRCNFGPPSDADNSDFSNTVAFERWGKLEKMGLIPNTTEQGVPVKTVVLLCLVSFVLALRLGR